MRILKAAKAAWREFWRVWKGRSATAAAPIVSIVATPGIQKPSDVPDSGFAYVGYADGKRECIADKRAKVLFLIARREGRDAQLWLNGRLRDWNPR